MPPHENLEEILGCIGAELLHPEGPEDELIDARELLDEKPRPRAMRSEPFVHDSNTTASAGTSGASECDDARSRRGR
jgi:hypothetical protein